MDQGGCLTENHRLKGKVKHLEDQLKSETEAITDRYEAELKKLRKKLKNTDAETDSVKSGESGNVDKMRAEYDSLKASEHAVLCMRKRV